MPSVSNSNKTTTVRMTVDQDLVPAFFTLLSQGFTVKTKVGCSVRDLLCLHMGLSEDYLENRLQKM